MALAQVEGAGPWGSATDARATRRALRAERAQLQHWRRLLRARLDLAVAGLAPPEALGAFTWDLMPDTAVLLPRPADLTASIQVGEEPDVVDLLTRLRRLDRMLSRYGDALEQAIEDSTQELLSEQATTTATPTRLGGTR